MSLISIASQIPFGQMKESLCICACVYAYARMHTGVHAYVYMCTCMCLPMYMYARKCRVQELTSGVFFLCSGTVGYLLPEPSASPRVAILKKPGFEHSMMQFHTKRSAHPHQALLRGTYVLDTGLGDRNSELI